MIPTKRPIQSRGFKRSEPQDRERPRNVGLVVRPEFRAAQPIIVPAQPVPKREYIRSKALLAAVRKLPCQHTGRIGATEPAHSNWPQHGKAGAIKADDNRVAALHRDVHRELDQGKNWSAAERQRIWWEAHVKTVRLLIKQGDWPMDVPVPDLRSFDA